MVTSDRLRIRETHVRDHLVPMLSRGAAGAVKLDLALRLHVSRAVDSSTPGLVDADLAWEGLHDMVRPSEYYGDELALKRKWVSDKLLTLERARLIRRDLQPGSRPRLVVLRDDASCSAVDDPAMVSGESYLSLPASALTQERLARWGAPELAAFMASMIAERYARSDPQMAYLHRRAPLGGGVWSHSLGWFADTENRRPDHHVKIAFSERTLRRGITALEAEGLMVACWISRNPRTGKINANHLPRRLYVNGFDALANENPVLELRAKETLSAVAVREKVDLSDVQIG